MLFETLNLKRAGDVVYNTIREKILNGELEVGQRIDVEQTAQQMGVSRTPIKDALQKLAAEGLIEIKSRKGTFVAQVQLRDLEETFEVREALELKACELLSGKLSREQATTLRELNEKMKDRNLTRPEHIVMNHEFHRNLIEFTGNKRLCKMYLELSAQVTMARIHPKYDDWKGPLAAVVEDHENIVDALLENRMERAQRILSKHIREAKDRLIARISEVEKTA